MATRTESRAGRRLQQLSGAPYAKCVEAVRTLWVLNREDHPIETVADFVATHNRVDAEQFVAATAGSKCTPGHVRGALDVLFDYTDNGHDPAEIRAFLNGRKQPAVRGSASLSFWGIDLDRLEAALAPLPHPTRAVAEGRFVSFEIPIEPTTYVELELDDIVVVEAGSRVYLEGAWELDLVELWEAFDDLDIVPDDLEGADISVTSTTSVGVPSDLNVETMTVATPMLFSASPATQSDRWHTFAFVDLGLSHEPGHESSSCPGSDGCGDPLHGHPCKDRERTTLRLPAVLAHLLRGLKDSHEAAGISLPAEPIVYDQPTNFMTDQPGPDQWIGVDLSATTGIWVRIEEQG